MTSIQASRGTKDILSPEVYYWQKLEAIARQVLHQASYVEVRTPIFEATELYTRGIGEATDIVGKEMYSFLDRGDRSLTLRPEGTAGVVRAAIEHSLLQGVQRLWYLGAMFRYERPQAGRQRQFHQLGVEVLGSDDPRIDAEVISLAINFLEQVGISGLVVQLNSVGSGSDRQVYRQALVDYFTPFAADLDPDSRDRLERNPLRILDSKDPHTQAIAAHAPQILNYLSQESRQHFEQVQQLLSDLNIPFALNPRLVRGLDYYTRTAFEIQSSLLGSQSAVCGGGRYDRLVTELGGNHTPAVGWAIGLERLVILLAQLAAPPLPRLDFYLVSRGALAERQALKIAAQVRQLGFRVELDVSGAKFDKQLKRADAKGAIAALIVGDAEAELHQIQIKWLKSGEQQTIAQTELDSLTLD
ncbi:MAG: histidine--tRNA ligase [Pseudanabaenaceae cyanobacterium bins.68]|nr:histidine--tRNA ligase [Pseudanabaenaceae cyanobacterium bins.68]